MKRCRASDWPGEQLLCGCAGGLCGRTHFLPFALRLAALTGLLGLSRWCARSRKWPPSPRASGTRLAVLRARLFSFLSDTRLSLRGLWSPLALSSPHPRAGLWVGDDCDGSHVFRSCADALAPARTTQPLSPSRHAPRCLFARPPVRPWLDALYRPDAGGHHGSRGNRHLHNGVAWHRPGARLLPRTRDTLCRRGHGQ